MEKVLVPNGEPLRMELEHFIDCVAANRPPLVGAADGIAALRLADRIRTEIYR